VATPTRHPPKPESAEKLAVALRYERRADPAPRIVAKGTGDLAEAIMALAREHGVAVREDADLAQLLSTVELETQIPVEAFVAVAEILSYVYQAKNAAPPPSTNAG
jgi:flagellar biosynthesis protein